MNTFTAWHDVIANNNFKNEFVMEEKNLEWFLRRNFGIKEYYTDQYKRFIARHGEGAHCTDSVHMCGGDCSACATIHGGCWAAKAGDTILFEAH